MIKVAIIAFTNPLVKKLDGGKIDIINRIKMLNNYQASIDLYTLYKKNEEANINNDVVIKSIFTDNINNKFHFLFSNFPLSVKNRYSKKLIENMRNKIYDVVIFENYNMFPYYKNINGKIKCLRVHNVESKSRLQLAKSNWKSTKSILELIESWKYKKIEKMSQSVFDYLLFISQDELEYMKKKYPQNSKKYILLPPVVELKEEYNISINNRCHKEILYYGDLTVSHNIEGLKWYVQNVFSKLNIQNLTLNIIGKISDKNRMLLEEYKNINVLGYVEDMTKYINSCDMIIAPIFTGAGVKIKVLHALSQGKILISTPKGIEGTTLNSNHLVIAKDASDFIKETNNILENPENYIERIENALEELRSVYSLEAQQERLKQILKINS